MPVVGGNYETIVISLQDDLLRKITLEEKLEADRKYNGPSKILIPSNDFLKGYFQSIVPYARNSGAAMTDELGILKVKEVVKLLLIALPVLRNFLFDFSIPYKIDLKRFMLSNYHFNVTTEKKVFGMPPRQWLHDKRLNEARHLIENKNKKPSSIYLDLGFESLSHF